MIDLNNTSNDKKLVSNLYSLDIRSAISKITVHPEYGSLVVTVKLYVISDEGYRREIGEVQEHIDTAKLIQTTRPFDLDDGFIDDLYDYDDDEYPECTETGSSLDCPRCVAESQEEAFTATEDKERIMSRYEPEDPDDDKYADLRADWSPESVNSFVKRGEELEARIAEARKNAMDKLIEAGIIEVDPARVGFTFQNMEKFLKIQNARFANTSKSQMMDDLISKLSEAARERKEDQE